MYIQGEICDLDSNTLILYSNYPYTLSISEERESHRVVVIISYHHIFFRMRHKSQEQEHDAERAQPPAHSLIFEIDGCTTRLTINRWRE